MDDIWKTDQLTRRKYQEKQGQWTHHIILETESTPRAAQHKNGTKRNREMCELKSQGGGRDGTQGHHEPRLRADEQPPPEKPIPATRGTEAEGHDQEAKNQ